MSVVPRPNILRYDYGDDDDGVMRRVGNVASVVMLDLRNAKDHEQKRKTFHAAKSRREAKT